MSETFPAPIVRSLCALLLIAAAGCGPDDGLPKRLPVSGRVTYNGEPLANGTITFVPEDPTGRGAFGTIEDGDYRLTTQDQDDGAIPGKYKVAIASTEQPDLSEAAAQAGAGVMDQGMVAEADQQAKSLIPERYADAAQSGLTAEVERGSTSFDFELTD